jgi:hypothetical protein
MAAPKVIGPEARELIARAVAEPDVSVSEELLRQADEMSDPTESPSAASSDFERVQGANWWRRVVGRLNPRASSTLH